MTLQQTAFKAIFRALASLLTALVLAAALPVLAAGDARTVVRVGYPLSPGLTEMDAEGRFSGYSYEYLQEIAQYTGWEYDFVLLPGTQNEVLGRMYDMLEKGEIDLMGGTNYSEELDKIYDYPENSYGSVYDTLEVLEENTAVNEANYRTLTDIRIAVRSTAKRGVAALKDFCRNNRITPTLVFCDSAQEQLLALKEQRADALLANDAADLAGTRIVARFNPKPFFFAVTGGNYELLTQLNSAMLLLNDADPYFSAALYQKYFGSQENTLRFTDEERSYLQSAPTFRVGVVDDRMPLADVCGDGTVVGIAPDLMHRVAEKTGLRFTMVGLRSAEEQRQALADGTIDLAPGIIYDYNSAQEYDFSMSKPYLSTQYVMAAKKGLDPYALGGKKLALPRGIVGSWDTQGEIIWYDSIPQCLRAVDAGAADYCYGNGYSVEYYCSLYRYRHLTLIPQSSQINRYCIGVARPANPLLLNILNKTLRSIPQEELQAVIYQNSTPSDEGVTMGDVIASNPLESFLLFTGVAMALLALLLCFAWFQHRARKKTQRENERYRLLFDLSGEYLFEYDSAADCLTLTDKTAQAFGCSPVITQYYKKLCAAADTESAWQRALLESSRDKKSVVCEQQAVLEDGCTRWLRITLAAIAENAGQADFFVGKIADIQAEKEELGKLAQRAQTDGLTGLCNVLTTRLAVERALAQSPAGALLMMDVDCFKAINDGSGHYTGDRVLQNLSALLRQVFREEDILGRIGGDEFVVFMKGMVNEDVVAQKCRLLAAGMETCDPERLVTLSIGAIVTKQKADYDMLYRLADDLLYAVKAVGGNAFRIATASTPPEGLQRK